MLLSRSTRTMMYISSCSNPVDANWLHVVPRAGHDRASVWLGTLNGIYPNQVRVSIYDADLDKAIPVDQREIDSGWIRPLSEKAMKDASLVDDDVVRRAEKDTKNGHCSLSANISDTQPYYNNIELSDLNPGTKYTVEVSATSMDDTSNKTTVRASFKTLPAKLGANDDAFTVFMGSCYYAKFDRQRVADAYEKLFRNANYPNPDLNMFMGDQVYLDIPFIEHADVEKADEMRGHMVESYHNNWQGLHRVFKHANNMFTADDHEFYNNYPFHPIHILRVGNPLKWKKTEKRWRAISKTLFRAMQTPLNRDQFQFDIGDDLSFMKVDVRVNRLKDNKHFMPQAHLRNIERWIQKLKSPGVLILGQPLIINKHPASRWTDKVLSNYKKQYGELMRAISSSKHDIVLLSGDVHYGRIAHVPLASGATFHEVIASPMSLIESYDDDGSPQLDFNRSKNLATVKKPKGPSTFPRKVDGVEPATVVYERFVRSKKENPKEKDRNRTEEHFKTVTFSKPAGSKHVEMEVRAWLPRLEVQASMAADNEIVEEDWSQKYTNRGENKGPYTVKLK